MATYTIKVPDAGRIKTYIASDDNYDIRVQKITQERIDRSGSQVFSEMVATTGAIADGQITYKNGVPGGIKELDEFISMISSNSVAFYIIG